MPICVQILELNKLRSVMIDMLSCFGRGQIYEINFNARIWPKNHIRENIATAFQILFAHGFFGDAHVKYFCDANMGWSF